MTEEQKNLLKELSIIQESVVNVTLSKVEKYNNVETMLKDVTYETIYRLMELIDGYRGESIKYNIVNSKSGNCINQGIDLHDYCEDNLECADI